MAIEKVVSLYAGAVNYADAAQLVLSSSQAPGRNGLILPTHTLIGLAIELSYKAVFLHRHGQVEKLKPPKVRHNLVALRDLASNQGFQSTVYQINEIIAVIADNYAAHEYRYMKPDSKLQYVSGDGVMPAIQRLIDEVAVDVGLPVRPAANRQLT